MKLLVIKSIYFILPVLLFVVIFAISSCVIESDECTFNDDCEDGFSCVDGLCIENSGDTGTSGNTGGDSGKTGSETGSDSGGTGSETGSTGGDSGSSGETGGNSQAECGNSVVEQGEECDDGINDGSYGGCNPDCTFAPYCGDGIKNGDEECDDGLDNGTGYGKCNFDCTKGPHCGDGIKNGDEQCDDGEDNSDTAPNACRTDCTLPICGDGAKDDGEECDDGAKNSDTAKNACRTDCTLPRCGDKVIDDGEQCDMGDQNSDTGSCTTECRWNTCGDGFLYAGKEQCDHGVDNSNSGECKLDCTLNVCGDGHIWEGVEVCDANINCTSLGGSYFNGVAICKDNCTVLDESGCNKRLPEIKVEIHQTAASDRMYVEWEAYNGTKCKDAQNSKTCDVPPVGQIWITGDGSGWRENNYAYYRDFQNITGTFKAKVSSSYTCEVKEIKVFQGGTLRKNITTKKQCKTSSPVLLMPSTGDAWDFDNFRWQ